ncbi:hypothetical protein [Modestobacter sp. SYSU DS0290]
MVALIAVVVVSVLVAVGLALVPADRRSDGGPATVLRWVAVGLALAAAAVLAPEVWRDSGAFAVVALGLPTVVLLVPALTGGSRWSATITAVAAAAVLAWAVVWGLGGGLLLLPAVVPEAVAAALTPGRRSRSSAGVATR